MASSLLVVMEPLDAAWEVRALYCALDGAVYPAAVTAFWNSLSVISDEPEDAPVDDPEDVPVAALVLIEGYVADADVVVTVVDPVAGPAADDPKDAAELDGTSDLVSMLDWHTTKHPGYGGVT